MSDSNTTVNLEGVPITAEPGIDISTAVASSTFNDWFSAVERDRFCIRSIHIQSMDMFGPRVGFLKWKADVVDSQGKFLPGIIFARGGSVAVAALLRCGRKTYVAVTVQPRLPTGSFEFTEVCAGMLDGDGNFAGVAAKELKEELQIELDAAGLTDLTALAGHADGIYLSPGGTEETMRFFAFFKRVSKSELDDINGRCTGALDENEQITVKLIEVDELLDLPDAKSIIAWTLIQRHGKQIPGYKR